MNPTLLNKIHMLLAYVTISALVGFILLPVKVLAWSSSTIPPICTITQAADFETVIKTIYPWFNKATSSYVYGYAGGWWYAFINNGDLPITFEYVNGPAYWASIYNDANHPTYKVYMNSNGSQVGTNATYNNGTTDYGAIASTFTSSACVVYATNVTYASTWNLTARWPYYSVPETPVSSGGVSKTELEDLGLHFVALAITLGVGWLVIRGFRWSHHNA